MGVIYKITNTINDKSYIGYTMMSLAVRVRKHKADDIKYCTALGIAIAKDGWENFKYEVIAESSHKEELLRLERYYISQLNSKIPNGYNMTDGGEQLFGDSNPFWGCHHSIETINLLSEKMSLRTGEKNPFYGKHHSETTKMNLSKANSKPIVALDENGEVVMEFSSQIEARDWCLIKGLTTSQRANSDISKRCKNGGRAFGYYWKLKNEGVETMPDECKAVG